MSTVRIITLNSVLDHHAWPMKIDRPLNTRFSLSRLCFPWKGRNLWEICDDVQNVTTGCDSLLFLPRRDLGPKELLHSPMRRHLRLSVVFKVWFHFISLKPFIILLYNLVWGIYDICLPILYNGESLIPIFLWNYGQFTCVHIKLLKPAFRCCV